MKYYITTVDSAGLGHHVEQTDLDADELREIKQYLGMKPDGKQIALAIIPINDGANYIVSYTMEQGATEKERRPHNVSHGLYLNAEEFENVVVALKDSRITESLRWAVATEEQWLAFDLAGLVSEIAVELLSHPPKKPWGQVKFSKCTATAIDRYHHVWLPLSNKESLEKQISCYDTLDWPIFSVSNGECTSVDADLILGPNIRSMKKQQFVRVEMIKLLGLPQKKKTAARKSTQEREEKPAARPDSKELRTDYSLLCQRYILEGPNEAIDAQIHTFSMEICELSKDKYHSEVLKIKKMLCDMADHSVLMKQEECRMRYIDVLLFIFANTQLETDNVLELPKLYDFDGLFRFLQINFSRRGEYEKMTGAFARVYLEPVAGYLTKKDVSKLDFYSSKRYNR